MRPGQIAALLAPTALKTENPAQHPLAVPIAGRDRRPPSVGSWSARQRQRRISGTGAQRPMKRPSRPRREDHLVKFATAQPHVDRLHRVLALTERLDVGPAGFFEQRKKPFERPVGLLPATDIRDQQREAAWLSARP